MKHRNTLLLAVGALLSLTFLARGAVAQGDGDKGDNSACTAAADAAYSSCADGEPWYVRMACSAQQADDYLDCGLSTVANFFDE